MIKQLIADMKEDKIIQQQEQEEHKSSVFQFITNDRGSKLQEVM